MSASAGAPAPRWKRVCVFVDGENFRHSLADLFQGGKYKYRKEDYLPEANWHHFFSSLVNRSGWELVRVYWYVIGDIDFHPYRIPHDWEEKRRFLEGKGVLQRLKDQGYAVDASEQGLKVAQDELNKRKQAFRRRAEGWQKVHASIERQHDQIQFQRFGSNRYDLVSRSLGTEKGVDTQLATDMITLSDIYDVAAVVSGDADYIPPVSAVKNLGKLVYSVSFRTANGRKLPGGAWRLERRVDGQIEVSFERTQELLEIEEVRA
ncbi:MAG: NYN domain-containing protein [Gammaproteobacteria bacterium]|nr:NYN domain-containing protein [Gammaproteobacteria bacterium]